MKRAIKHIQKATHATDGAGVELSRFFPVPGFQEVDPFLLFDHFGSENPNDYIAGFPLHPHRGIETITYMLKGRMSHKDSTGREGIIEAGDVQWMSAGRGIMHEEMPQLEGGQLSGFQIWINQSAKDKMNPPDYQEYRAEEIPSFNYKGHFVRLVCGELFGKTGPVTKVSRKPILVEITLNGELEILLEENHTALLYVFDGKLDVVADSNEKVIAPQLVVLTTGKSVVLRSIQSARLILTTAQALNEPMVRWGPFVMNTREEIEQTLQEIRKGVFPPS